MRTRVAVAVIVLAGLAGLAGIVVEASFGVPTPGPSGVAQPQVWALAGLLPLLATGTALSLWRPAERVPRLLLAMATVMAHPRKLDVLREIGGGELCWEEASTSGMVWLAPCWRVTARAGIRCMRILAARAGPPDCACPQTGACGGGSPLAGGPCDHHDLPGWPAAVEGDASVMRPARRPAWSLWILTLVIAAIGLSLLVWDWSAPTPAGFFGVRGFTGLWALGFGGMGALLTWRRPSHPVGWILAAAGLLAAVDFVSFEYGLAAADHRGLPAGEYLAWPQQWIWVPFIALITVYLPLLFPDGRLPSPRWRPVSWAAGGFMAIAVTGLALSPGPDRPNLPALKNPFGVPLPAGSFDAISFALAGLLGCAVLAVCSLSARARRGTDIERQQIKWLAYSGCLVALTLVPSTILSLTPGIPARIAEGALTLAILTVPPAVAVAVLKYRLYDLDVVVRKTVVAALVAGAFTAVYAIVVVAVGAVTGRPGSSPLTFAAAALAAVLLQPVRARAGLLADRLVYGRRATPYEVLSEFSGQMAGAYPVEDVLPRMAAMVGQATGAERAEVWMRTGGTEQLAAAWPAQALSAPPPGEPAAAPAPEPLAAPLPVTHAPPAPALTAAPEADRAQNGRAHVFEVEHQGERLGSLRVTFAPREPLTAAGERLVQAVAGQAGLILRNVGLVEDLRASRQRLVAAADQARRDLERDLHDGVQQQIVALMAKLRLARNQLARDPAVAGQTLAEAQAEAQQTLQDLRELARGIHPSVLSDQGILAAVQSRITRLPIGVRLTAGPELAGARYPDQIEGAAYFLVCEALVNVVKHAHASQVQVTLSDDRSRLLVEITDDGAGFVPADAAGSGLTGLTDRIEAVGGSLSIRSRPGTGTRLAGELPARGRRPAGA
jgi:signal transduction histidine kinase